MQFDYSSFIQGKTSHVVFLWKYIYYIYIIIIFFFFCKSHQVQPAQLGQEREKLAEGIRFLVSLPRGSGLSCRSRDEMRKEQKEILSKHERESSLSCPPLSLLSSSLPAILLHMLFWLASLAPKANIDLDVKPLRHPSEGSKTRHKCCCVPERLVRGQGGIR